MKKLILFGFVLFAFLACSDILEEDLREKEVKLNSPQNLDTLINYTVNFWWEEMDGAGAYRIQIVNGDFINPNALILDSVTTTNVFDFTLTPGEYEWRIKGLNNSTETDYSSRSFYVMENEDLTNDQVVLITPVDNQIYSVSDLTLLWNINPKADDYLIDVKDVNGNSAINTQSIAADSLTISLNEGIYTWSVQGRNTTSISIASTRSFTIDTTAPSTPSLSLPLSNSILDTTLVEFSWQNGTSLTAISDTLFIYSDSVFTLLDSYEILDEMATIEFANTGVYYWRVRSVDLAGNKSNYSNQRKLTIN